MNRLIKYAVVFLALAFVAGACGGLDLHKASDDPYRWASNKNNIEYFMNSVVVIIDPETGKYPACTGFFVSPDLIVSARHCYDGTKGITDTEEAFIAAEKHYSTKKLYVSYFSDYRRPEIADRHRVRIVAMPKKVPSGGFPLNDIILLRLDKTQAKSKYWLPIADKNPELASKVYSISMPQGSPWIFSEGVISQYYYDWDNFPAVGMLGVSIPVDHGSSGSPLVNNNGEVVGVTHGMDRTAHNASYVPCGTIRSLLYGWL